MLAGVGVDVLLATVGVDVHSCRQNVVDGFETFAMTVAGKRWC